MHSGEDSMKMLAKAINRQFTQKQRSLLIPKQVSFFEPTMRDIAIRKSGLDKIGDGLDDVYNKIFDLKRLALDIERRIPLLSYKPEDELDQIKFYV